MSKRCCAAAPHPGDYGRRREKKHQVGPDWSSVTHQVLTDRGPLVSIHRSSLVRQCAHFFPSCSTAAAAAAQGSALAPVAPVICQNICRRPKSFHSMAMTLEPAKATDWVRSYQEAAHKNAGQEKEKGGSFPFPSSKRVLWASFLSCPVFSCAPLYFPLSRLVSLELGRSFFSLTRQFSSDGLQLINFSRFDFVAGGAG